MNKQQIMQNKEQRYALNDRYPYIRDTRTLNERAQSSQLTIHYIREIKRYLQNEITEKTRIFNT